MRASGFGDLQGARISASIPVSERLLNALVAVSLPPNAKVRDLSVHPQDGNRFTVRVKLPVDFLPPVSLNVQIERQPEAPDSPLVLRLMTLGGLFSLIGPALPIASYLPPGVRLEKDRLHVDLRVLAERHGYGDLLQLVRTVRISTEAGRLMIEVGAGVD